MDFQVVQNSADPLPPDPASWRCLTASLDQGTDGWAAVNFLQSHLHINMYVIHDASHRVWNDIQLALQDAKLWSLMLAFMVGCNADHGPWADARFYAEAVEAATSYMNLTSPAECPLFQLLLPKILADTGKDDDFFVEDIEERTFASLGGAFAHKLPKVAVSRWFGIHDTLAALMPIWHSRLLVLMFLAVSEGWVDSHAAGMQQTTAKLRGAPAGGSDLPKTETSKETEDLKRLRSACRNTLHFTATLLSDGEHRQVLKGILVISGPLRSWHGSQNQVNRSVAEVCTWYKQQACGAVFAPLAQIAGLLLSPATWEEVGLWVSGPQNASDLDDPFVLAQNDIASKVCEYAVNLLSRRAREALWHCRGYPGSFAALLDAERGPKVMDRMRRVRETWPQVEQQKGAFWAKVKRRSYFKNNMVVQQAPPPY